MGRGRRGEGEGGKEKKGLEWRGGGGKKQEEGGALWKEGRGIKGISEGKTILLKC
jgi:hypothetical protein